MAICSQDQVAPGADGGEAAAPEYDKSALDPQDQFAQALTMLERANVLTTTKIWSPGRQASFLALIAEGATVAEAAKAIGVVERTAYSFRRRVAGTSFDVGWRAANLLARDKLHEELYARCLKGQDITTETTLETPAGEHTRFVTRHSHDNRLCMAMLTRLDRLAEDSTAPGAHASRLIAMDYDSYLAHVATGSEIVPFLRETARQLDDAEKTNFAASVPDEEEADDFDFD